MIKLVATDMDGTFLDAHGTYDKERLAGVLAKFKEQDIIFAAASGRSLLALKSLFADFKDKMAFIAENGSAVVLFGELVYEEHLTKKQYIDIANKLVESPYLHGHDYLLSGKNGAYVHADADDEYVDFAKKYYDKVQRVASFEEVDDLIFKLTANFTAETVREGEAWVNDAIPFATAVTTGFKSIDIILNHVDKSTGLAHLCEKYDIKAEEVLAFGDNLNDLEMLEWAGTAIATANARKEIKEAADQVIGNHADEVVMTYMEGLVD